MSNEIATKQTGTIRFGSGGLQLTTLDDAWRFATAVVKARLAPKTLDTAEKILIALQMGGELGFTPMQSLSSIAVINGRPTLYGDSMKALVERSPDCEYVQESVKGEDMAMVATCTAKRKGRPEPTVRTFSMKDAKQAGLLSKTGPWTAYPKRMLQMRARSWALRDQFADLLCGMVAAEEAMDMGTESHTLPSGEEVPLDDLDCIEGELAEPKAITHESGQNEPTEEELVAAGIMEPRGGALFDTSPDAQEA